MLIIQGLQGMLRPEEQDFQASLGYMVKLSKKALFRLLVSFITGSRVSTTLPFCLCSLHVLVSWGQLVGGAMHGTK